MNSWTCAKIDRTYRQRVFVGGGERREDDDLVCLHGRGDGGVDIGRIARDGGGCVSLVGGDVHVHGGAVRDMCDVLDELTAGRHCEHPPAIPLKVMKDDNDHGVQFDGAAGRQ